MENQEKQLEEVKRQLSSTKNLIELESLQIKLLGKKGLVNELLSSIKTLSSEDKKSFGQKLNRFKTNIVELIDERKKELLKSEAHQGGIDITLPGKNYPKGSLHLVSYAVEEISKIFQKIGFVRLTYPEVEWEYFSFDSLNMPKNHPARDDFETFFLDAPPSPKFGKMVLSMHTSSGQVREMWRVGKPPIRMISIAKCYRPNWTTKHTPMFHQFESLCVDTDINMTNLKGTISYFAKEFFGEKREIRLRPHHFQFTEPSFEVDITCDICGGTGKVNDAKCKICKQGWLELAGAGMVHPNVLREGKIDPNKYSGWAFAFGLERIMMMKEGLKIDDMRILYSGDVRFLDQF